LHPTPAGTTAQTGSAMRRGARPRGSIDGGSFGYVKDDLVAGKKVGNFEASPFASDDSQTVNRLPTLKATPDDRFTVLPINDGLGTRLTAWLSLDQLEQNSLQAGCDATVGLGGRAVSLDARNPSIVAILHCEPDRVLRSDGARELLAARAGPRTQARAPPQSS
jgi:hypothetical protein